MRPAVIITDMIEDFIRPDGPLPIGAEGIRIIPGLCRLAGMCRQRSFPLVYANDALAPDDFLFRSRMKPHALRGTKGARVIEELSPQSTDFMVEKKRFSAFFGTGLDRRLREEEVDTVVVGGIATEVCVLSTAYDAVSYNFPTIVLEDCCASRFKKVHEEVLSVMRKGPLFPLLKVMTLSAFLNILESEGKGP